MNHSSARTRHAVSPQTSARHAAPASASAAPRHAAPASASAAPRHAVGRKNIRLQGWDYSSPGWYFLTICTQNMRSVFGTVVNRGMILNQAGKIAEQCWREIPAHFPRAVVDEFVIMPNHVHGLLHLLDKEGTTGRGLTMEAFGKPVAGSISTILRSYKSAVTRALGERVWQSRFHDVRARDDAARENIRAYIHHNPENFAAVMQGAEPQYLGNRLLLDLPKMGFLASRGEANPHGSLPLKPGEVVISGFLSPMERAVFKACLEHRRPMIWVLPCTTACRGPAEQALAAGRLLLLSPFGAGLDAPNARRAVWCNQYVIEHCDHLVIGHLNPDGMLACLLSEANPEKDIRFL